MVPLTDELTRGEAARATITALRVMGRIEAVDAALVNELIVTADALDRLATMSPSYPSLVRAYTAIESKIHDRHRTEPQVTMLDPAPSRICSPRWATRRNTDRGTYGAEAAAVARLMGFDLMDWQREVFDVGLEHDGDGDGDGALVYREIVLTLPRQSGKSILMLVAILHRLTVTAERLTPVLRDLRRPDLTQRAYYTAQTGAAARSKFTEEWMPMIGRSHFGPFIQQMRRGNGSELIEFSDPTHAWGGTIQPLATTSTAGHGKITDLGMIDEAWADEDDNREQALVPGMNTRPSPQLWLVSTAGDETSVYLPTQGRPGAAPRRARARPHRRLFRVVGSRRSRHRRRGCVAPLYAGTRPRHPNRGDPRRTTVDG